MAVIHFTDGKISYESFSKAMKADFGIPSSDIKELYYNTPMTDFDSNGRTLEQIKKDEFPVTILSLFPSHDIKRWCLR